MVGEAVDDPKPTLSMCCGRHPRHAATLFHGLVGRYFCRWARNAGKVRKAKWILSAKDATL